MSKKPTIKKCFRCGQDIYFDPAQKSAKGKFVPLDVVTNLPHDCPKSNFKPRQKTVGEEIIDLEERERERLRRVTYD